MVTEHGLRYRLPVKNTADTCSLVLATGKDTEELSNYVYRSIREIGTAVAGRFVNTNPINSTTTDNVNKKRTVATDQVGFCWLRDEIGERFSGMP